MDLRFLAGFSSPQWAWRRRTPPPPGGSNLQEELRKEVITACKYLWISDSSPVFPRRFLLGGGGFSFRARSIIIPLLVLLRFRRFVLEGVVREREVGVVHGLRVERAVFRRLFSRLFSRLPGDRRFHLGDGRFLVQLGLVRLEPLCVWIESAARVVRAFPSRPYPYRPYRRPRAETRTNGTNREREKERDCQSRKGVISTVCSVPKDG